MRRVLLAAATLLVTGCAAQRSYREGVALSDQGRIEEGLEKIQQAAKDAPDNAQYRITFINRRLNAVNTLLQSADASLDEDKLAEAEAQYARVLKLDQENPRAKSGLIQVTRARKHVELVGSATKTNNGSLVYQIGTRNTSTLLRLKDGETQLLAGLINDEDRTTINGLPGLADLPLLGRLFSSHKDERQKTEVVLSITPHIVRNITLPGAGVTQFWSGTEQGGQGTYTDSFMPPSDMNDPRIPGYPFMPGIAPMPNLSPVCRVLTGREACRTLPIREIGRWFSAGEQFMGSVA